MKRMASNRFAPTCMLVDVANLAAAQINGRESRDLT